MSDPTPPPTPPVVSHFSGGHLGAGKCPRCQQDMSNFSANDPQTCGSCGARITGSTEEEMAFGRGLRLLNTWN